MACVDYWMAPTVLLRCSPSSPVIGPRAATAPVLKRNGGSRTGVRGAQLTLRSVGPADGAPTTFCDWGTRARNKRSTDETCRNLGSYSPGDDRHTRPQPRLKPGSAPPREHSRGFSGRMFLREKTTLTKGERNIILGICENRGDLRKAENCHSGEPQTHAEAWRVGKPSPPPLTPSLVTGRRIPGGSPSSEEHKLEYRLAHIVRGHRHTGYALARASRQSDRDSEIDTSSSRSKSAASSCNASDLYYTFRFPAMPIPTTAKPVHKPTRLYTKEFPRRRPLNIESLLNKNRSAYDSNLKEDSFERPADGCEDESKQTLSAPPCSPTSSIVDFNEVLDLSEVDTCTDASSEAEELKPKTRLNVYLPTLGGTSTGHVRVEEPEDSISTASKSQSSPRPVTSDSDSDVSLINNIEST